MCTNPICSSESADARAPAVPAAATSPADDGPAGAPFSTPANAGAEADGTVGPADPADPDAGTAGAVVGDSLPFRHPPSETVSDKMKTQTLMTGRTGRRHFLWAGG